MTSHLQLILNQWLMPSGMSTHLPTGSSAYPHICMHPQSRHLHIREQKHLRDSRLVSPHNEARRNWQASLLALGQLKDVACCVVAQLLLLNQLEGPELLGV